MTEITADHSAGAGATGRSLLNVGERTRKRNAAEKRFRMMGLAAVAVGIIALVGLMASILSNGLSSFSQTYIALDVYLDPAKLDKNGNRAPEDLQKITTFTIQPLIKTAVPAWEGVNPNEAAALMLRLVLDLRFWAFFTAPDASDIAILGSAYDDRAGAVAAHRCGRLDLS
jgi:hypothetical protein